MARKEMYLCKALRTGLDKRYISNFTIIIVAVLKNMLDASISKIQVWLENH